MDLVYDLGDGLMLAQGLGIVALFLYAAWRSKRLRGVLASALGALLSFGSVFAVYGGVVASLAVAPLAGVILGVLAATLVSSLCAALLFLLTALA